MTEPPTGRRFRREFLLAPIGSVLLAVGMIWLIPPYAADLVAAGVKPAEIANPANTIVGDGGDTAAQAWLISWVGHSLGHGLRGFWETNAFYPGKYGLALNDTLFGYAPAALIGDGVTAALVRYNILFVLAFALAFLGGYALLRQLGATKVAAAVAGAALAYAPWRYGHVGHLNILSTGGMTLALAMLARGHGWSMTRGYLPERVRPGWAVAGWAVAAWQVSLGFGVGLVFVYVLAGVCLVAAIGWLIRRRPRLPRLLVVGDLAGGLFFAAVTGYFAYAYQHVRELYPDVLRSWDYVAAFSPVPRSLLVAPAFSLPWGKLNEAGRIALGNADHEKSLLCGYVLYLLAFGGMFLSVWSVRQRLYLLGGAVAGVLFALGTHGPLYRLLYDYVPGFDGGRTPGRLILWPTILLAILAAGFVSGLAQVARRATLPEWSAIGARVVTVPLLLLVLAEGMPDLAHVDMKPEPAAMALATPPLIVLPSDDGFDSTAMLWSTAGFPEMVNGVASYNTPDRQTVRDVMQSFPSAASLDLLRKLGIRSVVVLHDKVGGTPYELALGVQSAPGLTRVDIGQDVLFRVY
ncbi:hypothetical protein [Paractinoplanes durhamensis]|uniref:Glycosyltransferase RgtA/B/C/D-like domain-containing protein n=1 Tax=Paractinoplanes durhamensis TaxID=113563 RepID=A0ABQ3YV35_9ACTN|nr:hypothetical protein [Actinoplanes durhamensis]GIE01387.1 hypothetical protein Adu01nite_27370 [Actinoplanes durhamensis]